MNKAIFTAGLRTPFGRAFKGAYKDIRADDLLVEILEAQSKKHGAIWNHGPDDLVVGCAYPEHEQGYNIGRMAALGVGLDVPGMTVNRLCRQQPGSRCDCRVSSYGGLGLVLFDCRN